MIAFMNALFWFTLFYGEVTSWLKWIIVASVPVLLNLAMWTTHYICYAVYQSLVVALHVVALKIRHTIIFIKGAVGTPTISDNGRSSLSQIMVMSRFILEVDEFLTPFDVH